MWNVSKGFRRAAALLALLTVLVAQGAVAADRDDGRGMRDRFERAKRFVMIVLGRLGWPPG
jgi:hypothetical protein